VLRVSGSFFVAKAPRADQERHRIFLFFFEALLDPKIRRHFSYRSGPNPKISAGVLDLLLVPLATKKIPGSRRDGAGL
jgi:hypothetical protein